MELSGIFISMLIFTWMPTLGLPRPQVQEHTHILTGIHWCLLTSAAKSHPPSGRGFCGFHLFGY